MILSTETINSSVIRKIGFCTVSHNRETYAVSKFYSYNLLKAVRQKKHIFHDLNCKGKLLICRIKYRICHIQHTGKSETEFNIGLNNHRIRALIDKTNHKQVNTSNCLTATLIIMLDLPWFNN